jgi:hypothetical protein
VVKVEVLIVLMLLFWRGVKNGFVLVTRQNNNGENTTNLFFKWIKK